MSEREWTVPVRENPSDRDRRWVTTSPTPNGGLTRVEYNGTNFTVAYFENGVFRFFGIQVPREAVMLILREAGLLPAPPPQETE